MVNDVIDKIQQYADYSSPDVMKRHPISSEAAPSKHQRSEVSLSKYELLRKERDDLQR